MQGVGSTCARCYQLHPRFSMRRLQKNGAPGGTRTPDLLVRRGISHYTPTHAVQEEPIESARESNSFRLLLYRRVPRSRTITRTKLRPGRFLARRNQALHGDKRIALKCSSAQFWCSPTALPSDCLPDVLAQGLEFVRVAGKCPCTVRESNAH